MRIDIYPGCLNWLPQEGTNEGGRQKWVEIVILFFIHQVNKENKDRQKHKDKGNIGHNYMNI